MHEEIKGAYSCADAMSRTDVKTETILCFWFGARIDETVTLRVWQTEHAIKYVQLEITNGKSGQARTIPTETEAQRNALPSFLTYAQEQKKQPTDYPSVRYPQAQCEKQQGGTSEV